MNKTNSFYFRRFARLMAAFPLAMAATVAVTSPVVGQTAEAFRIGLVTDMSSAYSDLSGKGSVAAVQMAIEDFGGIMLGRKIELVTADHQMKPSVGSAIVTEWFDRDNVSVVVGLAGSSVALAGQAIVKDRPKKLIIQTVGQTSELIGKSCLPNSIHWTPDFYALAVSATRYVAQTGGKSWYVMVQDTAAGTPARAAAQAGIQSGGGKIVGDVRVPANADDVSFYVLQAQGSAAENVAVGFGGADMVNIMKSGDTFGLRQSGVVFTSLSFFTSDVVAMGLPLAQGITFATSFYPTMSEEAKVWSQRFKERTGRLPDFTHAGEYEAVTHYLKTVQKLGSDDATVVVPAMKAGLIDTFASKGGLIRADNQFVRPMHLARVKSPSKSTGPDDFFEIIGTIGPDDAFSPLIDSACPMVKK